MAQKSYKAKRQDYKTPASIYTPLLRLAGIRQFHLDVCCSDKNIPALWHFIDGKKNGLTEKWQGYCFMNPPFRYTKLWVQKAVEEANNGAIVFSVLPADRLETKYYQEYILNNKNCLFAFLPGKIGFIIPGQELEEVKPSQKIMIAIFADSVYVHGTKLLWDMTRPFGTVAFKGGG